MCRYSEEGNTDCLGIFQTDVRRFIPKHPEDKVPHMGWNTIHTLRSELYEESLENQ
jgi:glutamine amidotransferase